MLWELITIKDFQTPAFAMPFLIVLQLLVTFILPAVGGLLYYRRHFAEVPHKKARDLQDQEDQRRAA